MRTVSLPLLAGFVLLVAACASVTPEEEARHTLFWDAARECEARYRTIRVRYVDPDGKVWIYDYAQAEVPEFLACYRKRAREKITGVVDAPEEKPKGAYVPERESVMPPDIGYGERKNLPF
ncbi:MAG: hypothetical protein ACREKF_05710 [Candidatus Methylomirabilales bacterium]